MKGGMKFTLIELLVVIAIIAILAGLLLPSLKRAKDFASQAKCAGNQRNLSVALFSYADANAGLLSADGQFNQSTDYWHNNVYRFAFGSEPPSAFYNGRPLAFKISFAKFKRSVFWCPNSSYQGNPPYENWIEFLKYGSYGLNYCYWSACQGLPSLSAVNFPSATVMMADSSKSIDFSDIVAPYYMYAACYLPRMRHGSLFSDQQVDASGALSIRDPGSCNVMMMDGHLEALKYGPLNIDNYRLFRRK